MAKATSDIFWSKLYFRDFRQHFKRMSDSQIVADIRESLDKIDDLDETGDSFGAKCVLSAKIDAELTSEKNRKNAKKRWEMNDPRADYNASDKHDRRGTGDGATGAAGNRDAQVTAPAADYAGGRESPTRQGGCYQADGADVSQGHGQGAQHGAGFAGVSGQGEACATGDFAAGSQDRRASQAAMGGQSEQETPKAHGGQYGLPESTRERGLQSTGQEAEVTRSVEPANSGALAINTVGTSQHSTAPIKDPGRAASVRKKLVPVGKTAMEMEFPEIYALWQAAPPMARQRSSTREVVTAWLDACKAGAPSQDELIQSIDAWKRSKKWAENGGEYIEGLHRWIKNRQWENPPASSMQIFAEQAKESDRLITEGLNLGY